MSETRKEQSGWMLAAAKVITKGPRLRTRAFIPFAALLLWLAARGPLNYWGLLVVAAGEGLRLWASGHLHKGGESLTTSGPYAYCRNPLYLGSLLLGIGFSVAVRAYWLTALLAALLIAFHQITIAYEESRLALRYKESFAEYRRAVPALLPRLRPWPGVPQRFSLARLLANREVGRALWLVGFAAAMALLSRLQPLAK